MASEWGYDPRLTPFERPGSDIKKMGYLKKLKTMRRKFFIFRSTSSSGPARLEYFDSEKKFRNGQLPKRSIQLHTCFNINKKSDSKHKYAIALYTKDDCFSVIADDEHEQESWLTLLLEYQDEFLREGDPRREHFEHVWQVSIQHKGLGTDKNFRGIFRLCLSNQTISLVRVSSDKPQFTFQLATVRSLAHNDCLFRMEVGSWAPTGAGELWMHVEDSVIAQSMHEAILNCMKAATLLDGFDETDGVKSMDRFGKRADSMHLSFPSREGHHGRDFRPRTVSESHTHSPLRTRTKQIQEQQRPVSTFCPGRSTSLPVDPVSPGTSPYALPEHHIIMGHRIRSDSSESRASRSSMSVGAEDLSPMADIMYGTSESQVIDEEDGLYWETSPDCTSYSSPVENLDKIVTDLEVEAGQASPYMDMHPGNITPPTATSGGYVDMTLRKDIASHDSSPAASESDRDPYMNMGQGRPPSSDPIPIRSQGVGSSGIPCGSTVVGGYMEMTHSTPLPTVREGGSNDGYLPMTPNYSQSPVSSLSSHLRPDPSVCMLAYDEPGEFHKRTYSLGSRPPTKGSSRMQGIHDSVQIKKSVLDNGRSCSAPHLIVHKSRGLNMDSPTPSASPLSMSYKSESSNRSDDSDSFMELDFHRPRTASDSHGYRPRASSFGKTTIQGHRPRSSSYGQSARTFKLKLGSKLGSYESVRTTSQELLHKASLDSISRGSHDSLRVSSNESLRKLSEELRTKTNLLNTDYIDMNFEKRKTPSPQPPGGKRRENGYMDMTLGSRTTSPSRSKSSQDSGRTSKSQSSEKLHQHGPGADHGTASHSDEVYINVEPSEETLGPGPTYMNVDTPQHCSKGTEKEKSSQTSSSENLDSSYVMYEPSVKGNSSGIHPTKDDLHHSVMLRPGSSDSLKRNVQQTYSPATDKHKHSSSSSKDGRRKSSHGSSKRKSQVVDTWKEPAKDTKLSSKTSKDAKLSQASKPATAEVADEYIEFAPASQPVEFSQMAGHQESGSVKVDKHKGLSVKVESDYIGFEPGVVGHAAQDSKPASVKSMISSAKLPEHIPGKSSKSEKTRRKEASTEMQSDTLPVPLSQETKVVKKPLLQECEKNSEAVKCTKAAPVAVSAAISVQPTEKSPIVPQSSDSAYLNLSFKKKEVAEENKDKQPETSASKSLLNKYPAESAPLNTSETKNVWSTVSSPSLPVVSRKGKPPDRKADKNQSKQTEKVRFKHGSGGSNSKAPTVARELLGSDVSNSNQTCQVSAEKGSSDLVDPSLTCLSRLGSTPCMLSLEEGDTKPVAGAMLNVDPNPRSRHSITDLSAYEQMSFPSNTLSTSQQQLSVSSQKVLNYASLDLGSSETVGEGDSSMRSPRVKSRHPSSAEEKGELPLSYAQIDFEKSENLKASGNKDVKFTL